MPTQWRRIPVTSDPELTEALTRVAPYFAGAPTARVVHDLAVRGADALVQEQEQLDAGIERLVAFSTQRRDLIDWNVLDQIDELAWDD